MTMSFCMAVAYGFRALDAMTRARSLALGGSRERVPMGCGVAGGGGERAGVQLRGGRGARLTLLMGDVV